MHTGMCQCKFRLVCMYMFASMYFQSVIDLFALATVPLEITLFDPLVNRGGFRSSMRALRERSSSMVCLLPRHVQQLTRLYASDSGYTENFPPSLDSRSGPGRDPRILDSTFLRGRGGPFKRVLIPAYLNSLLSRRRLVYRGQDQPATTG